jgi:D-Tyr-tRNAtyr deacylase
VTRAKVTVDGEIVSEIGRGLLVFMELERETVKLMPIN